MASGLRLLLLHLRRRPPITPTPLRRPLSASAATPTESLETVLAPSRSVAAGGLPMLGLGGEKADPERMASVAARVMLCHELLREKRWSETLAGLVKMVSQQGNGSAPIICDILVNCFDSSSILWGSLAASYATAQLTDDALYLVSQMKSRYMRIPVFTYDSILYSLRLTNMAMQRQLFYQMESHSVFSYSILIEGFCKQHRVEDALAFLYKERKEGRFKPFGMTFNILMSSLCKFGLIQTAWSVFCLMLKYGLKHDRYTYYTLIHGLCKLGFMNEALDLVKEATDKGVKLGIVSYNRLINGYRLLGLTREISEVIQMMRCQGIEPNIVSYTILIVANCEAGDIEEGMKIKNEILDQGLQLDIFIYTILIQSYSSIGDIGNAVSLYNHLVVDGISPTIITCNSLLYGYCKTGNLQAAKSFFRAIQSSGLLPTALTYNILMDAFANAGEVNSILCLFDEMDGNGIKPNTITYTVVIKGLCKQLRFRDAINVLHVMQDHNADLVTYSTLMNALANAGEVNAMLSIFNKMVAKGIRPDVIAYSTVIKGLCKQLRFHDAISILHDVKDLNADLVTYSILMNGLANAGEVNSMLSIFYEMVGKGIRPDTIIYNIVIKGLCKQLRFHDAIDVLHGMQGTDVNQVAYGTLMDALSKAGHVDSTLCLFDEMFGKGLKPGAIAYNIVIQGLCKQLRFSDAISVLYGMQDVEPDPVAYNMLIEGFSKDKNIKMAFHIYEIMLYRGVLPTHFTYHMLIKVLCLNGEVNQAEMLLEYLTERGVELSKFSYTTLMNALVQMEYLA